MQKQNESKNQNESTDFKDLKITNNFMFCNVMMDEGICKEFLERMMNISIDRIEYINSEQQKSASISSKTVRFDVYVEDGSRVFDIEMQMTDTQELPLRARYYQSTIDVTHLRKSQDYSTLCESYIIFIMPVDIFKSGLPRYTFENTCREKPAVKLGDKTQKIFYNFSAYNDEPDEKVRNILKYFNDGKASDAFTERMNSMLEELKMDEDLRDIFSTYEMDMKMREKVAAHNKALETARNFLKMGLAPEQVSQGTGLPLAEVTALQAEMASTATA